MRKKRITPNFKYMHLLSLQTRNSIPPAVCSKLSAIVHGRNLNKCIFSSLLDSICTKSIPVKCDKSNRNQQNPKHLFQIIGCQHLQHNTFQLHQAQLQCYLAYNNWEHINKRDKESIFICCHLLCAVAAAAFAAVSSAVDLSFLL